tara:strand:- start:2597 stop:3163 length:567 start_codon:yes stop_codon:yes gene_type:complete
MKFLEKYDNKKNIRFFSFKETLKICLNRNFKNIVETGTSRGKIKFFFFRKYNWKDGMSTIMFAEYAKFMNGKLHTCDISKKNITNAKKFTSNFRNYVNYYIDDSVNFLINFKETIDLLYLDSFDGHNKDRASKHQLEEAKASIDKLCPKALILLDDKGAKTNLSIDFYKNNGFKTILETENQILFSKV